MKFSDHERAVRRMMRAPKTRREMLKQLGAGMGTIGLAGLMADKGILAPSAQAGTSLLALVWAPAGTIHRIASIANRRDLVMLIRARTR